MEMRICNKCNTDKILSEDNFNFIRKENRYNRVCKKCVNEYNKKRSLKLEEQIRSKEYHKLNYIKNKERLTKESREYYIKNKEQKYKKSRDWRIKKHKSDPFYKLADNLRSRICFLLKNSKNKSTIELLDCSIKEFRIFLEQQFKPEMNWENWGSVWEIDHIIPCSSFDLTKLEEQQKCFHYSNHQPLFKTTEIAESFGYKGYIGNRNKGDKVF